MPKNVQTPDGKVIAFPDAMSDDQIGAVLRNQGHFSARPAGLPPGLALPGFAAPPVPQIKPSILDKNPHPLSVPASDGTVGTALQQFGGTVGQNIVGMVAHPYDTAKGMLTFGKNDPIAARLSQAKQEWATDKPLAVMHGLGDVATGVITDGALKGAGNVAKVIPDAARARLAASVDEPMVGTATTPRARFEAAKRLGVNLDLADATNSPVATSLKAVGRNSLAGEPVYEKAKAANIAALGNSTDQTLSSMSPLDREAGGVRLQDLLKEDQQRLKTASDVGHGEIHRDYGDMPLRDPSQIAQVGDYLQKQGARHAEQFPSLQTPKVDAIVGDASRFGRPAPPAVGPPAGTYTPPTISEALKARSGILDVYQNNPELVKSAADAKLQTLVGATHDAIMDSLPAGAQKTLRGAQLAFKEMKQTYDSPSSPLYDAVRTASPSSKVSGIGPATPESVRGVISRVGEEGRGILQRGTAEKLLGTAPGTDGYNFRSFPTQLSRTPTDYASELFGDHLGKLQDISDTSQALSKDLNPSGTAKQGQKIGEALAIPHMAGAPLLQYPLARLMTSPSVVDWAMRQPQPLVARPQGVRPLLLPYQRTGTD